METAMRARAVGEDALSRHAQEIQTSNTLTYVPYAAYSSSTARLDKNQECLSFYRKKRSTRGRCFSRSHTLRKSTSLLPPPLPPLLVVLLLVALLLPGVRRRWRRFPSLRASTNTSNR
jgi:hypothetical protein